MVRIYTLWRNIMMADGGVPDDHRMRGWPLEWRGSGLTLRLERICPHGVGHPDPDQFACWREQGHEHLAWHGCDGCCVSRCPMED